MLQLVAAASRVNKVSSYMIVTRVRSNATAVMERGLLTLRYHAIGEELVLR